MTLDQLSQGEDHLYDRLDSTRQEIQAVTTARGTEATQTTQILDEILEQILKLSLGRQQSNNEGNELLGDGHSSPNPLLSGPCSDLMASITQLCRLFDRQQTRTPATEAVDVIQYLRAVLSCMMSAQFLQEAITANLLEFRVCKKCCRPHVEDLKACLSSVYNVLLATRHITTNCQG